MKTALSVAGSDCSGGAGVQADTKTMSAIGVYAMNVITAVVAENTTGVISSFAVPAKSVAEQFDAVFTDIFADAVKIGMLPDSECMKVVAEKLDEYRPKNVVIDPVMLSKDNTELMGGDSVDFFIENVLTRADLITPNVPEAERIAEMKIDSVELARRAARRIASLGARAVLVKGGHLSGAPVDVLFDGESFSELPEERIHTKNTHGTGCTLSSAIASYLALGYDPRSAVTKAKAFVTNAIRHALELGRGAGPTNHFYELYALKRRMGECDEADSLESDNNPNIRAIIKEMRASGATDTEIMEFLLKVLP